MRKTVVVDDGVIRFTELAGIAYYGGPRRSRQKGMTVTDNGVAEARERFGDLAEELAGRGAVLSSMFGKPCLKAGSKAFACLFRDGVAFKLAAPEHGKALDMEGAELFDPSGKGRPMKEWVQVPVAHADRWRELGDAAVAYVRV